MKKYHLFFPNRDELLKAGHKDAIGVPVIFCENWVYQTLPNNYLHARKNKQLQQKKTKHLFLPKFPTDISMRDFGYSLVNFLEWLEATNRNWRTLEYERDILSGYQDDMLSGNWSMDGESLSPSTINGRVSEACLYLEFGASLGLRDEFFVPTQNVNVPRRSSTNTSGVKNISLKVRKGAVKENPTNLRMPTDKEFNDWISGIRIRSGLTKTLMCRVVCESAVRREECVQWRVDTLPLNPNDWKVIGNSVEVVIMHGAKGAKTPYKGGELIGPPRAIWIPIQLAKDIHEYRTYTRNAHIAKRLRELGPVEKKKAMKNPPQRLFISEYTGQPISAQRFYDAWKNSALPFTGWTVHMGRHYWACKLILNKCTPKIRTTSSSGPLDSHRIYAEDQGIITATATDVINTLIRPQLGHLSEKTSFRYVQWAVRVIIVEDMSLLYESSLEN